MAPTDDELKVAFSTVAERSGPTHVELALNEGRIELVVLVKRQQRFGEARGSLAFTAVRDREAGTVRRFRPSDRERDVPSDLKSVLVGPLCNETGSAAGLSLRGIEEPGHGLPNRSWRFVALRVNLGFKAGRIKHASTEFTSFSTNAASGLLCWLPMVAQLFSKSPKYRHDSVCSQ